MYGDDVELDYGPMEGEVPASNNRVRGSSQRKGKTSPCPICPGRFTNLRRHVICNHLPWYVIPISACWTCKIQFAQESLLKIHIKQCHEQQEAPHKFMESSHGIRWVDLMNGLIQEIAQQLEMPTTQLNQHVTEAPEFSGCRGSFHHWSDMPLIKLFNRRNQYEVSEITHKILPSLHIYSLLHWKVLALLIQETEASENLIAHEKELNIHPPPVTHQQICLIDSHFHLDIYLKETRCSGLPSLEWNEAGENIRIQTLIANYCYPRNWPTSSDRQNIRKDPRIRLTFGIHPKMVSMESPKFIKECLLDLETLVGARGVVAVGECGLDIQGKSTKDLDRQIDVLERQLQIAQGKNLPVVIHCRGDESLDDKCLKALQKFLDRGHHIHRHCFGGSISTYRRWKRCFPNCKFGISPFILMDDRHPRMRATVCDMDLKDLIIETDAPYLSCQGGEQDVQLWYWI